jgi:predicted DNA-binding transcriptional regulator YafY
MGDNSGSLSLRWQFASVTSPCMAKQRPDADRRVRQCEKFARLLRLLRLLLGHGRWNARALAQELGCSIRTLHRDLNVLTMSGVPITYDRHGESYSVPATYRFPRLEQLPLAAPGQQAIREASSAAQKVIATVEQLGAQLRLFCDAMQKIDPAR